MSSVSIREGSLVRSCYPVGTPDSEPPLLPGFGPRGLPIYPYPTIEWFEPRAVPRRLRTIELENEYLKLTFLPELNGRLYSLWDKLADCEVLFANPELKPGLVGLRGVWHATGIEINFPGSHTVTTVDEVACRTFLDPDGTARFVAWDVEAVSGMAWECTTSLAPGSAAVGMRTRLVNPTDLPHRYYFWVNAAYPIREGTRYIFPPSTRRIFIERGTHPGELGHLDYPVHNGVDISLFANLRHPAAHFAETPDEGFFGLHHPDNDTGVAHIADPHLVPGRKIWSWGFAEDGQLWHSALSDTGGPYCEVQSGPLRSQIEYRSLAPGQVIEQFETWLPHRGLGGLNHATPTVAAAWQVDGDALVLRVLAARALPGAAVTLGDHTQVVDLGPEAAVLTMPLPADPFARLRIVTPDAWPHLNAAVSGRPDRQPPRLRAARPVSAGQAGRYLEWQGNWAVAREQYRAAAEEDAAAAAALARLALARADADEAVKWSRRAINRDWHLPAALQVAALAEDLAGRPEQAVWYWEELLGHGELRRSAVVGLIDQALAAGDYAGALGRCRQALLEAVDARVLGRLWHACRRLGRDPDVVERGDDWARVDPLLAAERQLVLPAEPPLNATAQMAAAALLHRFADADAALRVLSAPSVPSPGTPPAMLRYAAAYLGGDAPPDDISWSDGFAGGAFAIRVLRHAVQQNDEDLLAHYQLACALAAVGEWDEATVHWAVAAEGPWAAEANRNLGLCAWQVHRDQEAAAGFYRHALEWDAGPRTLEEQDRLLAELGRHEERVTILKAAIGRYGPDSRVPQRLAAALLAAGRAEEALQLLNSGGFQLYEGGALPQQLWTSAHRALAQQSAERGDHRGAAEHYRQATEYPRHLGVGRPGSNGQCELYYRWGEQAQAAGDAEAAQTAWRAGGDPWCELRVRPFAARDRVPELPELGVSHGWVRNRLYQALCRRAANDAAGAEAVLTEVAELVTARGGDERLAAWVAAARRGEEPA